jgi:3-hydroxyacyl-CoA dehydrogenase
VFVFKAAVVGAGTMGGEIAQVIAASGVPVVLIDVDGRAIDAGLEKARAVTPDADAEAVMSRIEGSLTYDALGDVDFVVEAVPENMAVKQAVFRDLDAHTPGHAILASNTSGLSISEIANATSRPEKVVGFHFFWPASVMRVVEIVEADATSVQTLQVAASFAAALRRSAINCGECPGFVFNRILISLASELWRYQQESGASYEAVDTFVTEQGLAPMGPFRLADMSGLDVTLKVAKDLRAAYGDRFHVHGAMAGLVAEGQLGHKTGRGFYAY